MPHACACSSALKPWLSQKDCVGRGGGAVRLAAAAVARSPSQREFPGAKMYAHAVPVAAEAARTRTGQLNTLAATLRRRMPDTVLASENRGTESK